MKAAAKQTEGIRRVNLPPELIERVDRYAEDNSISRSQAIRELVEDFMQGDAVNHSGRVSRVRPVTFWVRPEMWARMRKKADRQKTTITALIERALEGKV